MPRIRVDGPLGRPPAYTLLDAAEVVVDASAHWRTGVEYFSSNCLDAHMWPGACAGTSLIPRTITVSFTGTEDGGAFEIFAAAEVDTGTARTALVSVNGVEAVQVSTGSGPVLVSEQTAAGTWTVVLTDAATETSTTFPITQAADGSVTPASVQLKIVDELDIAADPKRTEDPPWTYHTADPFTVYSDVACNEVGFVNAEPLARGVLEQNTSRAVERYVWDILFQTAPDYVDLTAGTPVSVVEGVALLLQYLAENYSSVGMLHASRYAMPSLDDRELIQRPELFIRDRVPTNTLNVISEDLADEVVVPDPNPELETFSPLVALASDLTPWAFGRGYSRAGRSSTGAGTTFQIYATGAVKVLLSPIFVHQAFTVTTNVKLAVAERTALVMTDCVPLAGVTVTGA
jgi:hypothetical protein